MVELVIMIPSITLFQHPCQYCSRNCSVVCTLWSYSDEDSSLPHVCRQQWYGKPKKGIVHIAWPEGDFYNTPIPLHNESRRLIKRGIAGMPIRIAIIHFAMADMLYFWLLRSFVTTTMYLSQRSRIRFHVGTSPIARGMSRMWYRFALCVWHCTRAQVFFV